MVPVKIFRDLRDGSTIRKVICPRSGRLEGYSARGGTRDVSGLPRQSSSNRDKLRMNQKKAGRTTETQRDACGLFFPIPRRGLCQRLSIIMDPRSQGPILLGGLNNAIQQHSSHVSYIDELVASIDVNQSKRGWNPIYDSSRLDLCMRRDWIAALPQLGCSKYIVSKHKLFCNNKTRCSSDFYSDGRLTH